MDKINSLMYDMKRELLKVGLKSTGLMFLSMPFIVILSVGLGIHENGAPTVLAIVTTLFIHFRYTVPNTKLIGEKYKKLVTEELERRMKDEDQKS